MRAAQQWRHVSVLMGLGLAAMGCSVSEPRESTPTSMRSGATTTPPAVTASTNSSAPEELDQRPRSLDEAVAMDDASARVIFDAREQLVERCMSEQGFVYERASFIPTPVSATDPYPSDELLGKYGYAWRAYVRPLTPEQPPPPAGFEQALNQCGPQAVDTLVLEPYFAAQNQIYNGATEVESVVASDVRNIDVNAGWSECMGILGYTYPSPDESRNAGLESPEGPESDAAVALALADYGCRKQVGYAELRATIRRDAVEMWIEEHPGLIAALEEAEEQVVSAALKIAG
jgi:hypothetical protein